jgi:peptidyl-dipeptidase Dcp
MEIHTLNPYRLVDVNAFEREALYVKRGLIPEIEPRYHYPYFSHIFDTGYSAGYYSYIWAEILDKDAYQAFIDSRNIFNRDIAASLRKNILSKGGMEDGMVLYENFRGSGPSREPLLKARGLIQTDETAENIKE